MSDLIIQLLTRDIRLLITGCLLCGVSTGVSIWISKLLYKAKIAEVQPLSADDKFYRTYGIITFYVVCGGIFIIGVICLVVSITHISTN